MSNVPMMRWLVSIAMLVSATASAEKLLVTAVDGSADAATKGRVAAEVQKLAHGTGAQVDTGDVTFAETALAVGCNGSDTPCRDQVLATMSTDEIVAITVMALPSGDTHVVVERIAKGATKTSQTTVPNGQPFEPKIDADIGPSFGLAPPPAPEPPPSPAPAPVAPAPPPTSPTLAPTTPTLAPTTPLPAAPTPSDAVGPSPFGTPMQLDTGTSLRGPIIGVAAGGALLVVSFVMWGEASSTQSAINNAPTRTLTDFQNLQNLESKGSTYANVGNALFAGGLVVGAVSGLFFWRHYHRAHAQHTAMVAPTLFAHGAGIAFTYGGGR